MPTDKQLVAANQDHEIKTLLKKWDVKRPQLLEIKGKKRSRAAIERALRAAGIKLKEKKVKTTKDNPGPVIPKEWFEKENERHEQF